MPPASASCPGAAAGANAQELSKHAWELAKAGDAEAALRCHLAATSRADANVFTYYHRAQTEMQLGLSEDGKRSFERALSPASFDAQVELVPSAATEAHFQLGKLERDAGNLAIAERHYRASIRLTPGAPGAHVMLGVTLRDQGRTPEALAAYTAGLNVQPAIPAAQYNRAQCLMGARAPRVQRTAQAHTHTPAFAPLHADPPQPFHQRMLLWSDDERHSSARPAVAELGRRPEALAAMQTAVRIDPKFVVAYSTLGDELSNEGRLEEAIAAFRTVSVLEPSSSAPYYSLGKVGRAGGLSCRRGLPFGLASLRTRTRPSRMAPSALCFARLLLASSSPPFLLLLTSSPPHPHTRPFPGARVEQVFFTQRRLSLAIDAHQTALRLPEASAVPRAYVHNDLGNALSDATGRQAEVLHHYRKAAALMPQFAEALSNVGTGLKESGRKPGPGSSSSSARTCAAAAAPQRISRQHTPLFHPPPQPP
jgi:tetratricopeptide (TPR) repeat protein